MKLIFKKNNSKLKETKYLKLSYSKAKKTINWTPRYDLNQTLKKIWEWYVSTSKSKKYLQITQKQINEYFKDFYEIERLN